MDEVPRSVRDAAIAAFDRQEPHVRVLDLVADTATDPTPETPGSVRRLRFEGHGCVAEMDVHGTRNLTVDVHVSPGKNAILEVRLADRSGHVETQGLGDGRFTDVPPGLTSVVIRWADNERGLARTAWVRL